MFFPTLNFPGISEGEYQIKIGLEHEDYGYRRGFEENATLCRTFSTVHFGNSDNINVQCYRPLGGAYILLQKMRSINGPEKLKICEMTIQTV